ncbi:MAG: hypothetical protein HN368_11075 [Spirochaetales bacterium]|jgi:zinc transport system substrate-binding protein|nr:hypothetical protein [Spirochaetales bacterium]
MKMRSLIFLLIFFIPCFAAVAMPAPEHGARVVASTSWTAAYALAAGAGSVYVLAPYEMQHPPEYELRASDMVVLADADLVIFAGYERMAGKIRDALGEDAPELLQISTDYSRKTIRDSVLSIAGVLETVNHAERQLIEINSFYAEWKKELADKGFAGAKVVTHAFLRPVAGELGIEVIGTYGPAPMEAKQIAELAELPADLIVDNWHNDVGRPLLLSVEDIPSVQLINFPGRSGSRSLLDVLRLNRVLLNEIMTR